jgi:hypothetical protein
LEFVIHGLKNARLQIPRRTSKATFISTQIKNRNGSLNYNSSNALSSISRVGIQDSGAFSLLPTSTASSWRSTIEDLHNTKSITFNSDVYDLETFVKRKNILLLGGLDYEKHIARDAFIIGEMEVIDCEGVIYLFLVENTKHPELKLAQFEVDGKRMACANKVTTNALRQIILKMMNIINCNNKDTTLIYKSDFTLDRDFQEQVKLASYKFVESQDGSRTISYVPSPMNVVAFSLSIFFMTCQDTTETHDLKTESEVTKLEKKLMSQPKTESEATETSDELEL